MKSIVPGSASDIDGRIRIGDQIVAVSYLISKKTLKVFKVLKMIFYLQKLILADKRKKIFRAAS